jgi:arylsulfatase A-like enzyme
MNNDSPLNRRRFLHLSGLGTAGLILNKNQADPLYQKNYFKQQDSKPNIIIIFIDDLGYADLSCQGCTDISTPYIDSIATNGIRFTDGYVSAPVCSPSRAGLFTGKYQQRFGHEFNPGPEIHASPEFGLPLTEVTLAERLKTEGYATGHVGKYHLGFKEEHHPLQRGFDEFFGFLGGGHSYFPWTSENSSIMRGTDLVEEKSYLTDAFTREAVDFIQNHHDNPFFLFLSYNAVHSPLQSILKYLVRFPHIEDTDRRIYAAMLAAVDDGVGAILNKLHELDIENDTLIFVLSDNGGPTPQTTSKNDPLRGYKGDVWEGGIRIPFLMQWKGHLPAGMVYDNPVISLDIFPTILSAVTGKQLEEKTIDGINLLPFLSISSKNTPHNNLYWRYGNKYAIRQGPWKLVYNESSVPELFNLDTDISETENLASQKPEIVSQLKEPLQQWNDELMDPLWYYASSINNPHQNTLNNYSLQQNYPNPFNLSTIIRFQIPKTGRVKISLFDINGRYLYSILNRQLKTGYHQVRLSGNNLSSGIYFYRLQTNDVSISKRCLLIK